MQQVLLQYIQTFWLALDHHWPAPTPERTFEEPHYKLQSWPILSPILILVDD